MLLGRRTGGTTVIQRDRATIRDTVPALYGPLLPPFFSESAPKESAATCLCCPMVPGPGCSPEPSSLFFDPRTKCCTYFPKIPNYLVGGLLSGAAPALAEGRRRVRARIKSRVGVTPWGLLPGKRFDLLYLAGAAHAFGRSEHLACPYHDSASGKCTVRPWWEATCQTWFCKHDAGLDGLTFWRALQRYIAGLEKALASYVLNRTGLFAADPPLHGAVQALDAADLDERPLPDADYRRLWGRFAGREEVFYQRAYALVRRLTRKEFEKVGGASLALRLRVLKEAHAPAVAKRVPPFLQRAPGLASTRLNDGRYRLTSYSEFDPLVVARAVFLLLEEFDGSRTNRQIGVALRRAGKAAFSERALLQLYQARILIKPQ